MDKKELKIRLEERLRVYNKSPQVTVTYADLSIFVEDILELLEDVKINGFSK